MASDEYIKALDKSLSDLESRVQQRDLLNAEIAGLKETVRVLSGRVQMSQDKRKQVAHLIAMVDSATPNLTDAVRALLTREYPREMTAVEVRNALEENSNFDDFSNSLSACHAALKRMLVDGDVEPGSERNGKATYRRVLKLDPVPTPPLDNLNTLNRILSGLDQPGAAFRPRLIDQVKPRKSLGQRIAERGSAYESGMRGNEAPKK
jgi:hypothetical protein